MREQAGTVTGYALGDENEGASLKPAASMLEDLRTIFATAEVVKMSTERMLELLAELRPQIYTAWSPEVLASGLRPYGVAPGQVWTDAGNRKGYKVEHVLDALERQQIRA
jgi:S-DNA-T family DNA segregation ATPase FtsK/SpoIIIE